MAQPEFPVKPSMPDQELDPWPTITKDIFQTHQGDRSDDDRASIFSLDDGIPMNGAVDIEEAIQ